MTGKWYFQVENCSGATLYNSEGVKIKDLDFKVDTYYLYHTFSEMEDIYLCIRNETDALVNAEVYIEAPFWFDGYIGTYQAEYKSSASLMELFYPSASLSLQGLDAHRYYAPVIETASEGKTTGYVIDLYVDDLPIRRWEGTFKSTDEYQYFALEPGDVMKFNGFDAGRHTVRIEVNGAVIKYTYAITGVRTPQCIGSDASSLYLLPDYHAFARFTADDAGVYTFQSDIPVAMPIYGRLTDEDGNVLDSKEAEDESYDFVLSASLSAGQTVTLEAWLDPQQDKDEPFYGVVTLMVNESSSEGSDIFDGAQCRALVIGQTYETAPQEIGRLDGCQKDAEAMTTMLGNLAGSPYTVTEKTDLTAGEILAAIQDAFADATPNDVSLFYYSGHGANGSGALVGNDGKTVTPEALRAALDQIPGTKIILLDSCFGGYLIGRGAPADAAEKAGASLEQFVSGFSARSRGIGSGYYVLTASSLYETSIGYVAASSLFTRYLLLGMGYDPDDNASWTGSCPADADNDGMYTLDELFVYCRDNVRQKKVGQTVCPWPYGCDQVIFIDETAGE